MIEVGGNVYVNASEAATYLGISRDTFYRKYWRKLKGHRFGVNDLKQYRVADLDAILSRVEVVSPKVA